MFSLSLGLTSGLPSALSSSLDLRSLQEIFVLPNHTLPHTMHSRTSETWAGKGGWKMCVASLHVQPSPQTACGGCVAPDMHTDNDLLHTQVRWGPRATQR